MPLLKSATSIRICDPDTCICFTLIPLTVRISIRRNAETPTTLITWEAGLGYIFYLGNIIFRNTNDRITVHQLYHSQRVCTVPCIVFFAIIQVPGRLGINRSHVRIASVRIIEDEIESNIIIQVRNNISFDRPFRKGT